MAGGALRLLFLALPAPAVLAADYYWPQQKGDVNRTGYSPYPVATDLSKGPTWSWEDPNTDVIRCTPLIDDKKNIYLGTQSGWMYKFSQDGKMLWSYRSRRGNTPTVSSLMDGSVYLNTAYGYVVSLDMETGKENWATQVSHSTSGDTACVFAVNGTIISGTRAWGHMGDNNLAVALNTDGSFKWSFTFEIPTFNFQASSPGDGTVIFQDRSGGVYRVSLDDGKLIWESGVKPRDPNWFTTGATICGPNGIVYAVSNYGNVGGIIHAYNLDDGTPVWRKEVGMPANQAVAFGKVAGHDRPVVVAGVGENPGQPWVFGSSKFWPSKLLQWAHWLSIKAAGKPHWFWFTHELPAGIVAFDAETGEQRWWYTPPAFSRPSCEGDESSLAQRMSQAETFQDYGTDSICLPDNFAQAVIGGDGTVYVGHQDGKLYAVADRNGDGKISEKEVSTYYFGHAFQGSQGLAPGMLAVAPCGGGLHVWKS